MEELQVDFIKDEQGSLSEIIFKGDLSSVDKGRVKETLSVLDLSTSSRLSVSFEEVIDMDLAFLQVFYAFLSELKKYNVEYIVNWPANEELVGLIMNAGFHKTSKL